MLRDMRCADCVVLQMGLAFLAVISLTCCLWILTLELLDKGIYPPAALIVWY